MKKNDPRVEMGTRKFELTCFEEKGFGFLFTL